MRALLLSFLPIPLMAEAQRVSSFDKAGSALLILRLCVAASAEQGLW